MTSIYFQIPDIFNSNLFGNNETDQVLKSSRNGNLSNCVCLKTKKPRNCLSSSSFLHYFSGIRGNTVQLYVAIKGYFSSLFSE